MVTFLNKADKLAESWQAGSPQRNDNFSVNPPPPPARARTPRSNVPTFQRSNKIKNEAAVICDGSLLHHRPPLSLRFGHPRFWRRTTSSTTGFILQTWGIPPTRVHVGVGRNDSETNAWDSDDYLLRPPGGGKYLGNFTSSIELALAKCSHNNRLWKPRREQTGWTRVFEIGVVVGELRPRFECRHRENH